MRKQTGATADSPVESNFQQLIGPVWVRHCRMTMKTCRHMAAQGAPLFILALAVAALADPRPGGQGLTIAGNPAPTAGQIQSLVARAFENQHHNDRAIDEFERVERVVLRKGGENSEVLSDHTERVLPSGTGIMRLQVEQPGTPFSQDLHRRQLQYAVSALDLYLHPNDHLKQDLARFEKRHRDRAELLDAAAKAFRITWAGRETRGSRTLAKLLLEPDPDYKPTLRFAVTFEHIRGAIWVDESQAQMARLEADITSDITFGGGIVGKVYRGGHFVMEQSEVAPGVWLPTLYTYDVDGRKFLFGFGIHERTEVTRYRHVGPPSQSIEIIRNELNNLTAETPAQ
jgi:hypothetical protein